MEEKKHIFAIGLDAFNRDKILRTYSSANYDLHSLFEKDEILRTESYDLKDKVEEARAQLRGFDGLLDGIVAFWDFPATSLMAMLTDEFDLPGPTLYSTLKCEHKYWSRVEQKKVVPDHVPAFACVDPFDEDAREKLDLDYPFWLKPVKAMGSELGFHVEKDEDFYQAIDAIRKGIGKYARSFNYMLSQIDLPDDVEGVGGGHCIAEGIIGGDQFTVSGYVHEGEVHCYGLVDSYSYPGTTSFQHYEYPSDAPDALREKMFDLSKRIIEHFGFDQSPFNIEFYHDKDSDKLWVLEVNPRISHSHGDIYEKVDGVPNHEIMVDLALGQQPVFPERSGKYKKSGKFFLREWEPGEVLRVPNDEEIARLKREIPDIIISLKVEPGEMLDDQSRHDNYSYPVATVHLGADSHEELMERFERCREILQFEVETE
ncbi:MAG: ATP-grasp domain-containing protein [Candidatus Sumerlaeota bacterium]